MVGVIDHLKGAVVLDGPYHFLAQERTDDLGREMVMVLRRQPVADIVQHGGDDPIGVGALAKGTRRRLQRMLETGDLVTGEGLLRLEIQFAQDAVGGTPVMLDFEITKEKILLLRPVLHLGKVHGFHRRLS